MDKYLQHAKEIYEIAKDLAAQVGWTNVSFAILLFGMHIWVYRLYQGRIGDKDEQIKELAKENREYRERFVSMMDKNFNYRKPKKP